MAEEMLQPAPTPTSLTPATSKTSWTLPLILILAIFSLAISGYLFWQNQKLQQQLAAIPIPSPLVSPQPTAEAADPTAGWKTYDMSLTGLAFKYPNELEVFADINSLTALAADKEYWIAYEGSDQIFLKFLLYRSTLSPLDWWNNVGKNKYDRLADELGSLNNPPITIDLSYQMKNTEINNKEALQITINSSYETPHTPKQNNLIIFQNKSYITLLAYSKISDTSLDISRQILSTFKFTP